MLAGTTSGLRARRPGISVKVIDTVGAGDTFSAALLAGLHGAGVLGADKRDQLAALDYSTLDELLHDAVLAAAICCSRRGADPPTRGDLRLSRLALTAAGRGRRMTAPDPFRHPPPTSQGPAASGRGLRSG